MVSLKMLAIVGGILVLAALAIGIPMWGVVRRAKLTKRKTAESNLAMGQTVLPLFAETEQTVRTGAADLPQCPNCGTDFGDANFCPYCGTPRVAGTVYCMPIYEPISAQEFAFYANNWLAQNPYIVNCTLDLTVTDGRNRDGTHISLVHSATFTFDVAAMPQSVQYGVAYLYTFRPQGQNGYSNAVQVAEWCANNPYCEVVAETCGGCHTAEGNAPYAEIDNFLLFRMPV